MHKLVEQFPHTFPSHSMLLGLLFCLQSALNSSSAHAELAEERGQTWLMFSHTVSCLFLEVFSTEKLLEFSYVPLFFK